MARGAYTSKKMSRQVAARQALRTMCPLLPIEGDQWLGDAAEPAVVDLSNGAVGANAATADSLEQQEVATLRLRLSDDRILLNTVGKTPVMVLQEHCDKHEGQLPVYTSTLRQRAAASARGYASHDYYEVTVVCGSSLYAQSATGQADKKKEAKQRSRHLTLTLTLTLTRTRTLSLSLTLALALTLPGRH